MSSVYRLIDLYQTLVRWYVLMILSRTGEWWKQRECDHAMIIMDQRMLFLYHTLQVTVTPSMDGSKLSNSTLLFSSFCIQLTLIKGYQILYWSCTVYNLFNLWIEKNMKEDISTSCSNISFHLKCVYIPNKWLLFTGLLMMYKFFLFFDTIFLFPDVGISVHRIHHE